MPTLQPYQPLLKDNPPFGYQSFTKVAKDLQNLAYRADLNYQSIRNIENQVQILPQTDTFVIPASNLISTSYYQLYGGLATPFYYDISRIIIEHKYNTTPFATLGTTITIPVHGGSFNCSTQVLTSNEDSMVIMNFTGDDFYRTADQSSISMLLDNDITDGDGDLIVRVTYTVRELGVM